MTLFALYLSRPSSIKTSLRIEFFALTVLPSCPTMPQYWSNAWTVAYNDDDAWSLGIHPNAAPAACVSPQAMLDSRYHMHTRTREHSFDISRPTASPDVMLQPPQDMEPPGIDDPSLVSYTEFLPASGSTDVECDHSQALSAFEAFAAFDTATSISDSESAASTDHYLSEEECVRTYTAGLEPQQEVADPPTAITPVTTQAISRLESRHQAASSSGFRTSPEASSPPTVPASPKLGRKRKYDYPLEDEIVPEHVRAKGPDAERKWKNAACKRAARRAQSDAHTKFEAERDELKARIEGLKAEIEAYKALAATFILPV